MPTPTFTLVQQQDGFALYQAGPAGASGTLLLYFLLVPGSGNPPAGPLSLQQSWALSGAYVLSGAPVAADAQALAGTLELAASPNLHALAWLTASPPVLALNAYAPGGLTGQTGNAAVPVLNVQLSIGSGTGFTLSLDPPRLSFAAGKINLLRTGSTGVGPLQPGGAVTVSLDPADPGRLAFAASWDVFFLSQLFADDPTGTAYPQGPGLRYFYPDPSGSGTAQLAYRVFPPVPEPNSLSYDLAVTLDPLNPGDAGRTSLLFSGAMPQDASLAAASTVSGAAVTLAPLPGAGLWMGLRPATPPAKGTQAYLAPQGPFSLSLPSGPARLMCGTSGVEFLGAAGGDTLVFHPGHPAYAPAFGPAGAVTTGDDPGPVLDATYTTAYATVQPGSTPAPRGYFAQPIAAVSYSPGTLQAMTYPAAVSAYVGDPAAAGVALPLATYGGVFLANPDGTFLNPGVAPAVFDAFEKQVLTPARHALAPGDALNGPVFADESGVPLKGGFAATPQGLLVQLNDGATPFTPPSGPPVKAGPAGTFQRLLLARSAAQYLVFDPVASGTVDGQLGNVLMRDQLFLVLNDWDAFGGALERELEVAGFNFEVAPDLDAGTARADTILVFKYSTTRSLASLICGDPSSWAEPGVFVTDVPAAQATLAASLVAAGVACGGTPLPPPDDDDDAFLYFRTVIAADPRWTGVLAFNAPINANGMPLDLQMLFAGIDGELFAHHFGVELNQLDIGAGNGATGIAQSSLFGVIHYPGTTSSPPAWTDSPPAGDYDFRVEKLVVAIRNSAITVFDCKVGMTIETLFGRGVTLDPQPEKAPPNTVVIPGRYQKHGSVGTVTFTAAESAAFLFARDGYVRVLDRFGVTGATLVPVGRTDNGDGTSTITSRFTLGGALAFNPAPFPGVTGLDLFTYGVVAPDRTVAGVNVSGLALDISFILDRDGKKQGAAIIVPDLRNLQLGDDPAGQRPGGLLKAMPLKLASFIQDQAGISASSLGGAPVNVAGLVTVPAAGDNTLRAMSWTTSKPQYAMRFSLPLGSLGSLAEAGASLDAFLVLAWGPSTATPDDDGAAVYVQLPEASAGAMGFNLQGLIKTTFGDANLARVDLPNGHAAYVLLFNNVALSVLGIHFPPKVIVDFILFSHPCSPGTGSMGWSLAATQPDG